MMKTAKNKRNVILYNVKRRDPLQRMVDVVMLKRMKVYFFAVVLAGMSLCGFECYVPDEM